MSENNPYKPTRAEIEALSKEIFEPEIVTPDQLTVEGIQPPSIVDGKEVVEIVVSDSNKHLAAKHIKDTLQDMRTMMQDMKTLARASQNSWFYQTAAVLAKNLIEGAKTLHALEDEQENDKSPKTVHNHVHVKMTSDKMSDLVQAHIKKKKNGEA